MTPASRGPGRGFLALPAVAVAGALAALVAATTFDDTTGAAPTLLALGAVLVGPTLLTADLLRDKAAWPWGLRWGLSCLPGFLVLWQWSVLASGAACRDPQGDDCGLGFLLLSQAAAVCWAGVTGVLLLVGLVQHVLARRRVAAAAG